MQGVKTTTPRFTENYLAQLSETDRQIIKRLGLDKEYGKPDAWTSSLTKKYSEVWSVEELIVSHWYLECRYTHTAGAAMTRFLTGLKDGKILGTRCGKCSRILIPPRIFCEWCFRDVDEWVEHSGKGYVSTYSISYIGTDPSVRIEKPVIVAVIWFDDTARTVKSSKTVLHAAGILHKLEGVKPDDVYVGMRVKPVWRRADERVGSILDIAYFTPVEGRR